jgi:hypothetical protein
VNGIVRAAASLAAAILMLCAATAFAGAASVDSDTHGDTGACDHLEHALRAQPPGAVLLASYPSEQQGPLHGAAFTYDDAVAAIALVACGEVALAARIGDALLLALDHDRYWHDGRLRNGYAAGSISTAPLALTGWWDRAAGRWLEDGYQAGSDSGNMAWAMLALLSLYRHTQAQPYRDGALRIARWVEALRDTRGAGGFSGGYLGHEPAPQRQSWKSTEHNTDLAAAFASLAHASGDPHWSEQARVAADFVDAMWSTGCDCFAAGTANDGVRVNPLLALDAQIWPLLALPGAARAHAAALRSVEQRLRSAPGFAYSEAGGAMWIEGTAQVAVLLELLHRQAEALALRTALQGQRAADGGYYASAAASSPTGFMLATDPTQPRVYFHLEHLGASAWAALAERGYDPFIDAAQLPP